MRQDDDSGSQLARDASISGQRARQCDGAGRGPEGNREDQTEASVGAAIPPIAPLLGWGARFRFTSRLVGGARHGVVARLLCWIFMRRASQ